MARFSLSWRPEDYLDIQWRHLPGFALSALRGFTGLAKGEAVEQLFDERLRGMAVGETRFPITTIVYNMDLGRVEYFGTRRTPELTIGELVRVAIALPVFIEAVPVADHVYVDGGIIELFPAEPVLEEGGYDHVFGVNFMLPAQFEPQDITGWERHRLGILRASRQLEQGYHLEFAQRAKRRLGDALTIIDPVDYRELRGVSFYDLFIDRSHWPRLIRQGYEAGTRALDAFREREEAMAARARPTAPARSASSRSSRPPTSPTSACARSPRAASRRRSPMPAGSLRWSVSRVSTGRVRRSRRSSATTRSSGSRTGSTSSATGRSCCSPACCCTATGAATTTCCATSA